MGWLQALRVWAQSDQIRASPRDGRLLRLRPRACVRVDGVDALVVARDVRNRPDGSTIAEVAYTCRAAAADFVLRVIVDGFGAVRVQLIADGNDPRALDLWDVCQL